MLKERLPSWSLIFVLILALISSGCVFKKVTLSPDRRTGYRISSECVPELERHVFLPIRFFKIEPCLEVTGRIDHSDYSFGDGDLSIFLKLDPEYEPLINSGSIKTNHGLLTLEFICQSQPTDWFPKRACKNFFRDPRHLKITVPPAGSHVRAWGRYVDDKPHNEVELHPASGIEIIP